MGLSPALIAETVMTGVKAKQIMSFVRSAERPPLTNIIKNKNLQGLSVNSEIFRATPV